MQEIVVAQQVVLVGDEVAELLLSYAAAVASAARGDVVDLRAVRADGREAEVRIVLSSGTSLIAFSSTSALDEPDNTAATRVLLDKLRLYDIDAIGEAFRSEGDGGGGASHLHEND